ncbi:DUF6084 family protein [Gandjariella thermophila]|uniref:Uncharacterized protein n=1 Tax=Gandjariella thermophila TaxID=1931992 RepID=A0A4D4J1M5_9PSEU|nr:DUF6084 family protein [Gandjariella thermophila]GDY28426.1 hypothetical protein GTS_00590 [Gandjariella thermophila]
MTTAATPRTGPPRLAWHVADVSEQHLAVVPTLDFHLAIDCADGVAVHTIALSTSVRLAVPVRGYDEPTRRRLHAVFGAPEQWASSLRDLTWAQVTVIVPAFTGHTEVRLPVPCGSDMDLAAVSYLHALRDGDLPLRFLFSGTVFYHADGRLRAAQVPWDAEAAFALPAERWHRLRARYFGDRRWLPLPLDSFDRLHAYRAEHAYPSWDATIDALLNHATTGRNG